MSWRRRGRQPATSVAAAPIGRPAAQAPAPLVAEAPAGDGPLRIAVVVPAFRRGSGGHTTIANLVRGLEARGHRLSLWIDDPAKASGGAGAFRSMFGPFAAPVADDLSAFSGADVALATGWQTVPSVLGLRGCGARAYLVQDHEPEFYGASVERLWAEDSYRHGLHCVTAGQWLAELVGERYGATATAFDLGIDHETYRPGDRLRHEDEVLFYARRSTPRRAVPLGLLALEELLRIRPGTTVALFGEAQAESTLPFPTRQLGVLAGEELADAYRGAAAGMVLSLTNHSLVAQEMAACGLPAVELDGPSTRMAFGGDSGITLAEPTPAALATALALLLDDPARRAELGDRAAAWARERTWDAAATQVEAGLRSALAER